MRKSNNNDYLLLHAAAGLLVIKNQAQEVLLAGCWAGVTLSDGTEYTTEGPSKIEQGPRGGLRVHSPGTTTRPTMRWFIEHGESARSVRLYLEIENTTEGSLAVERFDLLVAPEGLRGGAAADLRVAQTGWQSWSHAHPPVPLSALLPQASLHTEPPLRPPHPDGPRYDLDDTPRRV
jgi:hypothetical protein